MQWCMITTLMQTSGPVLITTSTEPALRSAPNMTPTSRSLETTYAKQKHAALNSGKSCRCRHGSSCCLRSVVRTQFAGRPTETRDSAIESAVTKRRAFAGVAEQQQPDRGLIMSLSM